MNAQRLPRIAALLTLALPLVTACRTPAAKAPMDAGASFTDREEAGELRFVCYNILWNSIFPEIGEENAVRFARLMRALDPDVIALQEIGKPRFIDDPNYRDYDAEDVRKLMNSVLPLPHGASWSTHKGADVVIVSRYPLSHLRTSTKPAGQRDLAIALVELPDDRFPSDLYVLNNHYKCCGGEDNDPLRQQQSDAVMAWLRDAQTPGGAIDLPRGTAVIVCGDLNIVGGDGPVRTLVTGDIADEAAYGPDFTPDWDGTPLTDAHPLHNIVGPDDYTWRDDTDKWAPGRLDYVVYTDSVLGCIKQFVLNTITMPDDELRAAGLDRLDVAVDQEGKKIDHYPLVFDFVFTTTDKQ